jgi:hypothetical protein
MQMVAEALLFAAVYSEVDGPKGLEFIYCELSPAMKLTHEDHPMKNKFNS